jgi:hypothetical protein
VGSPWSDCTGTVEETLNARLEAEADRLCNAGRCERTLALRRIRLADCRAIKRCEILLKANVIDKSEELILGQVLSGWGT